MSEGANILRGEAQLELASGIHVLRPSFAALVAAEDELGSLFAVVESAAEGRLKLSELAALFWHCTREKSTLGRAEFNEHVMAAGLAKLTPPLKILLRQILAGQ